VKFINTFDSLLENGIVFILKKDKLRDDVLARTGLRVIRFSDKEAFESIDAVMVRIRSYL